MALGTQTITMTFDKSSKEVTIDVDGFPDDLCLKETKNLEELFGKVSGRKLKAEGYRKAPAVDNRRKVGTK